VALIKNLEKVRVLKADKDNEKHRESVWNIFNGNIEYFHLTSSPISYEEHCKWWETAFEKEYIYVIQLELDICGYIRLSKFRTDTKEKHEISIALSKDAQYLGIGSIALKLFEIEMSNMGISKIIANTEINNKIGQNFFEKNGFLKSLIRFEKRI